MVAGNVCPGGAPSAVPASTPSAVVAVGALARFGVNTPKVSPNVLKTFGMLKAVRLPDFTAC